MIRTVIARRSVALLPMLLLSLSLVIPPKTNGALK